MDRAFWLFLLLSISSIVNVWAIRVRVGHIGAINAMPKSEAILEMCRRELWKEGVLNKDFDIEILSQMGCGESFEGVAVGADLYHQQNVKVFVGPYCNTELDAVAKMAAFWNVPIIGYMASSNVFADKTIYKTLARVSLRTTNSLAVATYSLLHHYGWKRVAIVTNTGVAAFERLSAFEEIFHRYQITVIKKFMFDENADAKAMLNSGLMEDIKSSARIIICIFSSTREMTKEFMNAATQAGIKEHDFVYILPWLQAEAKDASPWIGQDGQMLQNVKEHFGNTIIIDDANGFDNALLTPFKERLESNNISVEQINLANIYGYIHLYDSLKLYALAATRAINETGSLNVTTDGLYLWNKMRRMEFPGLVSSEGISSGTVIMDDLAERAAVYAAFYVAPNRDEVMRMLEMNPYQVTNCDGPTNRSGCMDLKITDLLTGFWPSTKFNCFENFAEREGHSLEQNHPMVSGLTAIEDPITKQMLIIMWLVCLKSSRFIDGKMPPDEPVCGFRNEKCDYTFMIVLGVLALIFVLAVLSGFIIYRFLENRALEKTSWRIFRDDMRVVSAEEIKSMLSIGSTRTKLSNMATFAKHHAIIGTNTHASFHMYPQRRPISFVREDLRLLNQMKQAIHDNLNPFLGLSFNEKEEMLILWKGTVQDIIYNDELSLDTKFHAAFIRDITLGLEYLHSSAIGYHGSLTPWSCLIDRNWMVKLTDYGIANPLERWEKSGSIAKETLLDGDEKSGAAQAIGVLYCAPELLQNREQNRRRGMDQNWVKQSQNRRQSGDIYAFGMVCYEILFRSLPFPDSISTGGMFETSEELVNYLKDGSKTYKPAIQDKSKVHPDIASLLLDCWSSNPEIRPSIRRVRLNTENYLRVKGSLVDQMMRMMETYANNLEKLVAERTGMLEEANQRADKLLNQLLPSYVANELKLGRAVPPRTFKQASIFFSDIVGFTTLCSNSTPLEVVTMLNSVYTGFDDIINKHGAYKVETIGDAYLVVSGIPQENGTRHLMHLSDVALEIMIYLIDFPVPHRKSARIKIRVGLHTGPVASGVVGITAPRYCLFGDTVNHASRMESTGVPEKIQVSQQFKEDLEKYYPEFCCKLRGEIEVKGKGVCTTYFLEGKRSQTDEVHIQEQDAAMQQKKLGI
ncbi:Guanylate cyclase [Aphelenchoides bicaudatus]|nr:Guanylate cyclase [Aphelenchoides bicaudatus]